jgi:gliding motility-associated protein GldM
MAALKETPRQKMMGILYLVLLGIAATTVTDHVLDAFRNLTVSLETSTKNVQNTVNNTFAAFEATNMKNEPERARPIRERALQVKTYCETLDNSINETKTLLIQKGGDIDEATGDVKARANIDISPRVMIRGGEAQKLKSLIEDTRNKIIAIAWPTPGEQQGLHLALNAEDPPKRKGSIRSTWEEDNFGEGIPLTAAITALTKIQADLKNTESDAVKKILGEADKAVINLDRFQAVAIAPSSYILLGQQYKADVFLTAFDSKTNPDITVGGQKLNIVDGKGLYEVAATSEGEKKWSGVIRIKQTDGTEKEYDLPEQTYYVAKPSATVSPTKMNVFYIGVPNPVSVSAPGISMDKVHVGISEGQITGSNGQYVVNVKQRGNVKVTVSADFEGRNTVLSTSDFRVKPIPPPHVKFGGKGGGRLTAAAMKAQNRIFAVLDDFEFDAPFTIQHFTMYITKPRGDVQVYESTSNAFTPAMMSGMNSVVPGSKVYFDLINGTGVDGMKRQLDPIIFTVE